MSNEMDSKDKMIALLITQLTEQGKKIETLNEKVLELTKDKQESMNIQPIALSKLQSLMDGTQTKKPGSEAEAKVKKAIDLIVENKALFGF